MFSWFTAFRNVTLVMKWREKKSRGQVVYTKGAKDRAVLCLVRQSAVDGEWMNERVSMENWWERKKKKKWKCKRGKKSVEIVGSIERKEPVGRFRHENVGGKHWERL